MPSTAPPQLSAHLPRYLAYYPPLRLFYDQCTAGKILLHNSVSARLQPSQRNNDLLTYGAQMR